MNKEFRNRRYSGIPIESISEIRPDTIYSKSNVSKLRVSIGYAISDALKFHPNAPAADYDGCEMGTAKGDYYEGKTIIDFFALLESNTPITITAPPWMHTKDKTAETVDMVALIMDMIQPELQNAIYQVIFNSKAAK